MAEKSRGSVPKCEKIEIRYTVRVEKELRKCT